MAHLFYARDRVLEGRFGEHAVRPDLVHGEQVVEVLGLVGGGCSRSRQKDRPVRRQPTHLVPLAADVEDPGLMQQRGKAFV